jgi:hypothetical protein
VDIVVLKTACRLYWPELFKRARFAVEGKVMNSWFFALCMSLPCLTEQHGMHQWGSMAGAPFRAVPGCEPLFSYCHEAMKNQQARKDICRRNVPGTFAK